MEITLKYTLDEVNALLTALGQLPFNTSAGFISNIQLQATPQVQAQQPSEPTPETKE
jgi:hypothetical protein